MQSLLMNNTLQLTDDRLFNPDLQHLFKHIFTLKFKYLLTCFRANRSCFCLRALFPCGNKAVTFITSPHKKRKLSPPDLSEAPSNTSETSSPPALVSIESGTVPSALPSHPRYIPPHLVLEGARKGRSPTPEPSNTAGSSPSGAYASLSLESDGYASGADIGANKRRGSIANSALRGGAVSPVRSSSPAKRRVSTMTNEDVDMVNSQDTGDTAVPGATSVPSDAGVGPRRKSKSQGTRHKRETSVDMHAQETDLQSATSSTSSTAGDTTGASSTSSTGAADMPSIDDQIQQVMELAEQPMREGQIGYIVACKWLDRVRARGSAAGKSDKYGKEAREGEIGPVDNFGINLVTDPSTSGFKDEKGELFVPLKPGLNLRDDYEILPQAAWELIVKWYGLAKESPVIRRYCHNTSTSETQENLLYEVTLPVFTILKLPDPSNGITPKSLKEKNATPVKLLASRHELYQLFLRRAKEHAGVNLKTKVRLWRILGGLGGSSQGGMMTPAQSRSNSPAPGAVATVEPGDKLVLDINTFANLQLGSQRELIEAKDESANEKYNGHLRLGIVGLGQDEVIVLEEQIGGPAGGEWVSDVSVSKAKSLGVPISITKSGATTIQNSSLKPNANTSRSTSPAPGGIVTRGRQAKNGRTRGTVGLNNLGNTCYMNSALQCVRSVKELTEYFLLNIYLEELNEANPLSHNGHVAKAYGGLLHEMYSPNSLSSFAPRTFKNVIGKYGPSFSGWQQQDSQEFLLFLLDGLQEDLNRVKKKPYIEKPDSTDEMVNDPIALMEMANKCWDIYKARNDSVITDLFAGMYKSTVVCPVCDKVSIIFDPFNNLTLQLPIESLWTRNIFYFPLHSRPILVSVDIDKNASFMALKDYVAGKVGTDPKRTVVAEVYKNKFYKIFDDRAIISDEHITDQDAIGIWEFEKQSTNFPPPKKLAGKTKQIFQANAEEDKIPEGDTTLDEQMLISVYHRHPKLSSSRYQTKEQKEIFGVPSFIVLSRTEAKDYDTILRKVLACAETLTTRDFLRELVGTEGDDVTEEPDTVLMNTDEADSSSDSRVQAKSLESEDDMIDISMRNSDEQPQPNNALLTTKPLAPILRPGSFIVPEIRNLFDMKVLLSNGNDMVPVGLTTLSDENKNYPSLASRISEPMQKPKMSTNEEIRRRQEAGSPPSSDEDADDVLPSVQGQAQAQAQDSDDESDGCPPVSQLVRPTTTSFGKQAKARARQEENSLPRKDAPLLHLGESIIVDWTAEAYDALFGNSDHRDDDLRGAPTCDSVPTLPDPALEEKRRIRNSRRRNGVTLDDCLDEFGKPEILSQNDAWYCPRCKEHRRASKTFELWKAPDILVIHLKRFSAHGRFRDKLDVRVDFPVEGLDLSTRLAVQEDGKSPIYDLIAVDNHYGGLGGGHYTAYAQNFYDGEKKWYEYNDSTVMRRADPKNVVVTAAAYLLFYRRRSETHLGGPFLQQLFDKAAGADNGSQPTSRATSPSGEGKRLDDSSRNGLSSALHGVGAAHQAGGGGSMDGTIVSTRTGVDDDLPAYAPIDPRSTIDPKDLHGEDTLESLENQEDDDDEGIGGMPVIQGACPLSSYSHEPNWSFGNAGSHSLPLAAPASEGGGEVEDLWNDAVSNKAVGSSSGDEDDRIRMADFTNDEGTTGDSFGTPVRDTTPVLDVPTGMEIIDEPATEIMLED